jgi:hypothetical protein
MKNDDDPIPRWRRDWTTSDTLQLITVCLTAGTICFVTVVIGFVIYILST